MAATIESTLSNLHFYEITGKSTGPGREDEVRGGASCWGGGGTETTMGDGAAALPGPPHIVPLEGRTLEP